jgi:hypothetical protein
MKKIRRSRRKIQSDVWFAPVLETLNTQWVEVVWKVQRLQNCHWCPGWNQQVEDNSVPSFTLFLEIFPDALHEQCQHIQIVRLGTERRR